MGLRGAMLEVQKKAPDDHFVSTYVDELKKKAGKNGERRYQPRA
jgi:hypothetical protein